MKKISLTLAVSNADHTRDIVSGKIPIEGVELTAPDLVPEEIFHRFTIPRMGYFGNIDGQSDPDTNRAHGA
jgi:hypothetical protein